LVIGRMNTEGVNRGKGFGGTGQMSRGGQKFFQYQQKKDLLKIEGKPAKMATKKGLVKKRDKKGTNFF